MRRQSFALRALLAASALAAPLAPAALRAQGVEVSPQIDSAEKAEKTRNPESPVTFVIDGVGAQARGQFRDYVSGGFGGQFALLLTPPRGILGLRLEGGIVEYGHESKRINSPFGGRIDVDLTTNNDILMLGVGPQLTAPSGAVRPYVAGTAGLAAFITTSSVNGSSDSNQDPLFETTNHHNTVFAWTASGGFYIPMKWGKDRWSLDVGVTYHGNDPATYLRHGDITDNPDGSITLNPQRSQTRFLSYRLGVRIGS